jgi:hypothetical protein
VSPQAQRDGETIHLTLESVEVDLLHQLPEAMRSLLTEPDPTDPAVERLFPTCVSGDDDADAEVRELIFDDLLEARLDALDEFIGVLDRGQTKRGRLHVALEDEEPHVVLAVLNDVRLTLGARIGIEHLDREEIDLEHPAAQTIAVMDHLAWIQEELLRAIDPPSVEDDR